MGFLLELFDDTLVDSTAFVDEMAGGGRLARVDVTDDDDVDVELFFTHLVVVKELVGWKFKEIDSKTMLPVSKIHVTNMFSFKS